jgi:hypothetical protein
MQLACDIQTGVKEYHVMFLKWCSHALAPAELNWNFWNARQLTLFGAQKQTNMYFRLDDIVASLIG